jgi:hypothetical protein
MIFLGAEREPTLFLMLTEQDCNDMRGGRTKFANRTAMNGRMFDHVVISVHPTQAHIEDMLRAAGHGKLLEGMSSLVPEPPDAVCGGCDGIMKAYQLLDGRCIACWRELARVQERRQERLTQEEDGAKP